MTAFVIFVLLVTVSLLSYAVGLSDSRHIDAVTRIESVAYQLECSIESINSSNPDIESIETEIGKAILKCNLDEDEATNLTEEITEILELHFCKYDQYGTYGKYGEL